jgi:hypothetical protein
MAQPPPAGLATRAFTPIQNPTYIYNDDASFKATPQPRHVLDRPETPSGGDRRLTSQGSMPPVSGLPHYVPFAPQTPHNVWEYPQ